MYPCTIIKTRFFRPKLTADCVIRRRLHKSLDAGADCLLSLVAAPAGYGKSSLVASWLQECKRKSVWLSLDQEIDTLNSFLLYFVSAVRQLFPLACPKTYVILNDYDKQSLSSLATLLINELIDIEEPFILVLDDYGYIRNPEIHDLLNIFLANKPPFLQLVLTTRSDPPLPLASFRGQGELVEIRQTDLSFTLGETEIFLQRVLEKTLDSRSLARILELTEGWPAGVRLLAISLRQQGDIQNFLRDLQGDTRNIQEYLIAEVLANQPSEIKTILLKVSILNRFCAPLIDTLCDAQIEGRIFIEHLEQSGLFVIPLDEQYEWNRFHHLFRELLQLHLDRRYNREEITALHQIAGKWFAGQGLLEEAFDHFLQIEDLELAARFFAKNRHELMNKEQWHRLRRLLNKLPRTIIENNPELLLQDAWGLWNQMRIQEMVDVLDRVDFLLGLMPDESVTKREMQGEVDALRSIQYYLLSPCDGSRALVHAQQAMQGNPTYYSSTRGMAVIMLAMSHQLTGDLTNAFRVVFEELKQKEAHRNTYHTRLLTTLCFIYWVETDLGSLKQTGQRLWELGIELQLFESSLIGQYCCGLSHYCRNELVEAEKHLLDVVKDRDKINIFTFAHSSFVLSLTHQEQGRPTEACEVAESVVRFALDTGNAPLLQLAHAFQAELALRQGNMAEAVKWTKNYEPMPLGTAHRFYVPQLTLARILLAQNTKESRQQVEDLLSCLNDFYESIHNSYCLINILAMQAMLYTLLGDEAAADEKLSQVLALAEPGGFIRIFLDLGPDMAKLLLRRKEKDPASAYIRRLLHAFAQDGFFVNTESAPDPSADFIIKVAVPTSNPLTQREQEILELLSKRLSNQEIADRLFISRETVKRHIANMYRKLQVKNRRQAVEQATLRDILS